MYQKIIKYQYLLHFVGAFLFFSGTAKLIYEGQFSSALVMLFGGCGNLFVALLIVFSKGENKNEKE